MINSLFRRFIKILDLICSSFFSRVPSFLHYLVAKLHLNHCKASPCVVNFSFFLSSFCLPEFFMEALHGASLRIPFILQLFFKISLGVKVRQAILKDKHGVLHMLCFEEFKHSSSCIPKCNSFYLISWDGVMPFLTISIYVSWFTSCQESDILNPSFSIRSRDLFNRQSLHWSYLGIDFT